MALPARSARRCGFATPDGDTCTNTAAEGQIRCADHGAHDRVAAPSIPLGPVADDADDLWYLTDRDRQLLAAYGVDEASVAAYPRHLSPMSLPELIQAGISPAEASRWPDRFTFGSEVVALIESGLSPEEAAMWPQRFSGSAIAELHRVGLTPSDAAVWPDRFDAFDIVYLTRHNVGPREATPYPDWLSARQTVLLLQHGLGPDVAATIDPEDALTYDELAGLIDML